MLQPDTVLQSRYRVVRKLGQGGMGAVYEALDTRLKSTVALKQTLVGGDQLLKAFEREAQLLSNLQHPALPHVIDYFSEEHGQFLVMQYIAGEDLGGMLKRERRSAPLETVLVWADQLLDVLAYLHANDPPIVHRDIKPDNLKLTNRGTIVLLDFGLAKGSTSAMTKAATGSILGYTPSFAPLEQIRGLGTDVRSDLYSAAATLYALLSGETPTDALTRADSILNGSGDPLPRLDAVNAQVPVAVADVLHAAMALKRDDRPAAATEMRSRLAAAARSEGYDRMAPVDTPSTEPFTPVRTLATEAPNPTNPGRPSTSPNSGPIAAEPVIASSRRDPAPPRTVPTSASSSLVPTFDGSIDGGPSRIGIFVGLAALAVISIGVFALWQFKAWKSTEVPAESKRPPSTAAGLNVNSAEIALPAKANDPQPPATASPQEKTGELAPGEPPSISRVTGGILNGKAIDRPQPRYPPMARAAGVEGAVVVEVSVSEVGRVVRARAISGHPLLRDSAVRAARDWTFAPTLVDGAPVKVVGTITFNFRKT
ncbi:MAG: TonB family protein [Blastocatellia bacterium]